ncbi:MAG TPA: GNAT family N-acetyltransferase [Bacteroidia bacterium]|nr:GNAT family N-acetyltransferase [Bacteroidia bacterium]
MQISFPKTFPELKTERLKLRLVSGMDSPIILRLYSDGNVMKQRGEPVFSTEAQAGKLIFYWRKLFAEENGLRWGIVELKSGKLIGTVGFKKIMHQHFRADIGYELDPEYWNKGIMTEAVKVVTEFGFTEMNLHSIEANITPDHLASKRVLEKLGFRQEALFRENYFYEGWWDSAIWCLRK